MKFRTLFALLAVLALILVGAGCGKSKKENVIACLKEMTDFVKSDAMKDMFPNGTFDQTKFEGKMEEITKKYFKDKTEADSVSKELEADADVKKALDDFMNATMDATKKYLTPAMPVAPEAPATTPEATPEAAPVEPAPAK